MITPEVDRLRRAAERLDALDRTATEGPWVPGEDVLNFGVDALMGEVAVTYSQANAALIVALRPAVKILVEQLRGAASLVAVQRPERQAAVARRDYADLLVYADAVLGETDGGEQQ